MKKSTRVIVAVAAVSLLVLYLVPLWRISLDAPQYPEGLGLRIWVSDIRGAAANDLQNINTLNHYIGMRPIEASALPELRIMPFVIALLVALGLAAAAAGRRWLLGAWTALLVVAAVAGLGAFYRWAYIYGHDLDPNAIMKVPGMSYQPPIIGSKQLLNFHAMSWPDIGGWIAVAVGLTAVVLTVRELRSARRGRGAAVAAAAVAVLLSGCAPGPRAIAYGEDACTLCRMVVADDRYGSEVVTRTGRVHAFDSIECMATFLNDSIPAADVASAWVTDYEEPTRLIDAATAYFLHSPALRSPMGADLTAFADSAAAAQAQRTHGGRVLGWHALRQHVAAEWRPGMGARHHGS